MIRRLMGAFFFLGYDGFVRLPRYDSELILGFWDWWSAHPSICLYQCAYMSRVHFEPVIPVFERFKIVRGIHSAVEWFLVAIYIQRLEFRSPYEKSVYCEVGFAFHKHLQRSTENESSCFHAWCSLRSTEGNICVFIVLKSTVLWITWHELIAFRCWRNKCLCVDAMPRTNPKVVSEKLSLLFMHDMGFMRRNRNS